MAAGVGGGGKRRALPRRSQKMTMLIFCSNCGSYAPQSCIFSQVLNTGAAVGKFFPFTTGPELPKGSLAPPSPDQDNWTLFPREHILALLPQNPRFRPQPSSLRPQSPVLPIPPNILFPYPTLISEPSVFLFQVAPFI